jgi:hypothetical protein
MSVFVLNVLLSIRFNFLFYVHQLLLDVAVSDEQQRKQLVDVSEHA